MKERILAFLLKIARNEDSNLIEQIATKANLSTTETVARAQHELRNILHNYSHFSVKTIDSFNQKILRGFAREIGLPGNFKLELDTKKILDHAITRVIENSGENPEVKKWIIDFSREKMEDGQSWDITKDLKNLAKELYNEQFKLLETIDPAIISSTPKLGEFIMTLKKIKRSFEDKMKIIGQEAVDILQDHHFNPTDFYQGNRGVFQYFLSIQKPIDKYSPNSYVLKCQEEVEQWPSSKTPRKQEVIEVSGKKLLPLLHQAILLYNIEHREYATASAILKNTYALGLFSEVKRAIDQYKIENDTFLLSDTNVFLRGIIRDNDTPFIYEKTGSWYHHFLIDEFQDTSRLQWENLKPLLVNSLDENNRNLIVGDAKQSIYRWRGGDWELLEKEISRSIGQERVEVKDLDTNWRSVTEVLQFNNALFDILPGIFRKTFLQETPQEFLFYADDFQKLFHNSTQKEGKNNGDFNTRFKFKRDV